jgi:transposase
MRTVQFRRLGTIRHRIVTSVSRPPRLISDELWALVEPLIPPQKPAVHERAGWPRTSDREVREGVAFGLSSGIGGAKLHQAVLDRLGEQGALGWSRASLDSVSVRAKRGVLTGPNPDLSSS